MEASAHCSKSFGVSAKLSLARFNPNQQSVATCMRAGPDVRLEVSAHGIPKLQHLPMSPSRFIHSLTCTGGQEGTCHQQAVSEPSKACLASLGVQPPDQRASLYFWEHRGSSKYFRSVLGRIYDC